jgi:hypothetical protein
VKACPTIKLAQQRLTGIIGHYYVFCAFGIQLVLFCFCISSYVLIYSICIIIFLLIVDELKALPFPLHPWGHSAASHLSFWTFMKFYCLDVCKISSFPQEFSISLHHCQFIQFVSHAVLTRNPVVFRLL